MIYDPREYEPPYVSALEMSKGTSARLDFSFFGALTELPGHQKIPVGDITFDDHCVVIEVKTKGDLAGSMVSGRLLWAIWHMYLLKQAGLVQGFGILVRDLSKPVHEDARASYLMARRALAKWSARYGFSVLLAEGPEDVVEIAKSFMREFVEPKEAEMPPPLFKKELLEWDLGIQSLCMIPGIYIELAKAIMTRKTFWDIAIDCHEMDEESFCVEYGQLFNFGGKENKRLKSIWKSFNDIKLYKKEEFVNTFRMKTPEEMMKLRNK